MSYFPTAYFPPRCCCMLPHYGPPVSICSSCNGMIPIPVYVQRSPYPSSPSNAHIPHSTGDFNPGGFDSQYQQPEPSYVPNSQHTIHASAPTTVSNCKHGERKVATIYTSDLRNHKQPRKIRISVHDDHVNVYARDHSTSNTSSWDHSRESPSCSDLSSRTRAISNAYQVPLPMSGLLIGNGEVASYAGSRLGSWDTLPEFDYEANVYMPGKHDGRLGSDARVKK